MPSVVHFEIGADDPERAVKFYGNVFGWKVERFGEAPYWLVEPGEVGAGEAGGGEKGSGEAGPGIGGAIMPREGNNTTVNTISVPSLDKFVAKVEAAGGRNRLRSGKYIGSIGRATAICSPEKGKYWGFAAGQR